MNSPSLIILLFAFATAFVIKHLKFEAGRKRRRDYYNNVYLKSD